jgi:hypothetical protein
MKRIEEETKPLMNGYVTMKFYLPGTHPGQDTETLTLENPWALQFTLEALYKTSGLVGNKPFTLTLLQGGQERGRGVYRVAADTPYILETVSETGDIAGMVQEAWIKMLERCAPDIKREGC